MASFLMIYKKSWLIHHQMDPAHILISLEIDDV